MRPSLDITDASIVLIGKFDPALITPGWLAYHSIIDESEAKLSEVTISHPDVTQFDIEWAKIYADKNRLQISTTQSPHIRISDLFIKLLTELLPGTPVWTAGINLSQHYRLDKDQQDRFGELLAPRANWGAWGQHTLNKGPKKTSGLTSICLRQGADLEDRKDGYIDVRIEPSQLLKNGGIHIHINDHYNFGTAESTQDNSEAIKLLDRHFEESLQRSELISAGIIENIPS